VNKYYSSSAKEDKQTNTAAILKLFVNIETTNQTESFWTAWFGHLAIVKFPEAILDWINVRILKLRNTSVKVRVR